MNNAVAIRNLAAARKTASKFVVIWGFYTNSSMLQREEFTSRTAAWSRVQELMTLKGCQYVGGPATQLCLIQVYVTVPGTHGYSVKFYPSTAPQYAGPEGMAGWSAQSPFIDSGVRCG